MGGQGSGSYYRWSTRATVEDFRSLDIRRWKREGLLDKPCSFTTTWTIDGEETSSIQGMAYSDRVILTYRCRINGGDWEDIRTEIELDYTHCNFGGRRVWFLCPYCSGRVAKLYGGKYFWCRECHELPYRSQGENDIDRAMRKAKKYFAPIRSQKSGMLEWLEKPKGMHWKTFWKLYDKGMAEMERARIIAAQKWDIWGQMAVSDAMPCTPYMYGSRGRIEY